MQIENECTAMIMFWMLQELSDEFNIITKVKYVHDHNSLCFSSIVLHISLLLETSVTNKVHEYFFKKKE